MTTTILDITKHNFRDAQEERQSQLLDGIHRQALENMMIDIIMEKSNMSVETEGYLFKQEYLKGQLNIIQYLLSLDQNARNIVD